MRPFTTGRLRWYQGTTFAQVAKGMVEFFQATNLRFDHHNIYDGDGIFMVWRGEQRFEFLDRPWEDDPMLKPAFLSANWSVLEPDGSRWAGFSYHWENQPAASLEKLPAKVSELSFSFEGLLYYYSGYMATGPFETALKKYQLMKDLFRALDCDELIGVDGNAAQVLSPRYAHSYPTRGSWCFRFAKRGLQVLIGPLEERQMPRPDAAPGFTYVHQP